MCSTHSFFTKTAKKIRKLISTKYHQWNSLQTCVMITKLRYLYLWIFFFHFMPNSFSKSFKIYCIITFTHGILDLHFIRWNIWWIKLSSMTYLLFHSYYIIQWKRIILWKRQWNGFENVHSIVSMSFASTSNYD